MGLISRTIHDFFHSHEFHFGPLSDEQLEQARNAGHKWLFQEYAVRGQLHTAFAHPESKQIDLGSKWLETDISEVRRDH